MINTNPFVEYTPSGMTNYKIIPDYEVGNTNNIVIAQAISNMYETPRQRTNFKKLNLYYQVPKRTAFNMLLGQRKAGFYLSTVSEYKDLVEGKMKTVWNKCNINETDGKELIDFKIYKTEVCELILKDYNFKSLDTNRTNLYPLTNMLGIVRDLKEDEKIRVFILIEPIKRSNWVTTTKDELREYKKGKVVNNEMSTKEKMERIGFNSLEAAINLYIDYKMILFESIFGVLIPDKEEKKEKMEIKIDSLDSNKKENSAIGLGSNTIYKLTSTTFKTRIVVLSESENRNRAKINMLSVANSYKDLTGDNELVIKLLSRREQEELFLQVMDEKASCSKKCILSDKEVAKLMQLPQKDLQKEYKLENIDTREVEIPKELSDGGIPIGKAKLKGKVINTNWCNNYNVRALSKIVTGPSGAGKSEYSSNYIVGTNKVGDAVITLDYIKDCEMSKTAISQIDNPVVINLAEELFAFAYPEVSKKINESASVWDRIVTASDIAQQVKYLVNSISDSDNNGPLSNQMARYLIAAAKIVFIHPGEIVDNVFKILEDWEVRNEYIRKSKGVYKYNDRVLNTLRELNEKDEDGRVIGTRTHLILGIINRISTLLENPILERMLQSPVDNHDFTKYMNDGRAVFILMPQKVFKGPATKDVIVTYFMTRIYLAALERSEIDKPKIAHIITDEVHQVPTAASFISNHITEFRKFGIAPYFTVHYMKQFRTLLDAVKSTGVSYMLIAGTEKDNLQMLAEELHPFTVNDGLSLKPFHSLNIISYGNQYAKFISLLPKPISKPMYKGLK